MDQRATRARGLVRPRARQVPQRAVRPAASWPVPPLDPIVPVDRQEPRQTATAERPPQRRQGQRGRRRHTPLAAGPVDSSRRTRPAPGERRRPNVAVGVSRQPRDDATAVEAPDSVGGTIPARAAWPLPPTPLVDLPRGARARWRRSTRRSDRDGMSARTHRTRRPSVRADFWTAGSCRPVARALRAPTAHRMVGLRLIPSRSVVDPVRAARSSVIERSDKVARVPPPAGRMSRGPRCFRSLSRGSLSCIMPELEPL